MCHIPASTTGDEGWDRFSFSIKLEDYKRKIDERQLVLCVHYSVENKDWWDSNNGMNYSFTFKKSAPKRLPRNSGSANFGGSYFGDGDFATSLPGLRKGNTLPPSSQIKKVFGSKDNKASAGSSHWTFPKLFPHFNNSDARPRSDSPVQSPPPNSAYEPPAPPTVHTHLSLSKYCAPSPRSHRLKNSLLSPSLSMTLIILLNNQVWTSWPATMPPYLMIFNHLSASAEAVGMDRLIAGTARELRTIPTGKGLMVTRPRWQWHLPCPSFCRMCDPQIPRPKSP